MHTDIKRYPEVIVPAHPVRLTRQQVGILRNAIEYMRYFKPDDREHQRLVRAALNALPTHAPYDVEFGPYLWPIVSTALRTTDEEWRRGKPTPGSFQMKARGVYRFLIQRGYGRVPMPRPPRAP